MRYRHLVVRSLCVLVTMLAPHTSEAQRSLSPTTPSGQSVTPVFEGWYRNKDGTYSLSFGYYNRNTSERMDIAVGDENFVTPGSPNQGQPSHFAAKRHWGVFAVTVPANFGDKQVVWTLKNRGQTFAIPGHLKPDWQIDALEGEASADNTPPTLTFSAGGAEGRGPFGVTSGPLTATVGKPITVTVMVTDDAKTGSTGAGGVRVPTPVDLTWFKHQGPGDVTFGTPTNRLAATGGTGSTTATFTRAGDYLLRVRANDSAVASAGHAQCCWTNGFIKVTVTP